MSDLPTNYRPDPALPPDLEEKRQAAVLRLGTKWLLHPDNGPQRGQLVWQSKPANKSARKVLTRVDR